MNKIGFIGFGNMGGTMLTALLKAKAIPESKVIVFTRTKDRLKNLTTSYPKVEIAESVSEVGAKCNRIFICTTIKEVKPVLTELAKVLPEDAHIISIAGTIETKCLETIFKGKITHLMPTIICEVEEGTVLVCHNKKISAQDKEFINLSFNKIGKVKEIDEKDLDLCADLTSCAPAFYAAILGNLIDTALKHGSLNIHEIKELVLPTCYGTAKLLMETNTDFNSLIMRVATKGGITEEGVKVLNNHLPQAFDEMLHVTLDKREKVKKLMREQYGLK